MNTKIIAEQIFDNTPTQIAADEDAIADELVANGVPSKDIVLAYHSPYVRQYTEFAIG